MAVLVIAEHDNQSLKGATLNTVTAAARLGDDVHILVAGYNCRAVAEQAAKVAGVTKVRLADAEHYAHPLAENWAPLVVGLAQGYSHLLAPATTTGKNLMPRVAALLDVAQISEIVAVESADTFVRPIYAGNVLATVRSADSVRARRRGGRYRPDRDDPAGRQDQRLPLREPGADPIRTSGAERRAARGLRWSGHGVGRELQAAGGDC